MMNVGAAPTSVGGWLGSADDDSRSDGLADGFWLGVDVAMAEGTPARTPSPDVGRGPAEPVGRTLSSQLEPMATDPTTSTSAAAATAYRATSSMRPRPPTATTRRGGAAAAPTSTALSVSMALAERRQRSQPAA
jgi:hypothetical protein